MSFRGGAGEEAAPRLRPYELAGWICVVDQDLRQLVDDRLSHPADVEADKDHDERRSEAHSPVQGAETVAALDEALAVDAGHARHAGI